MCSNLYCGHTFVSYEQIVRTLSPAAVPAPGVHIPFSPRKQPKPDPDDQGSLL